MKPTEQKLKELKQYANKLRNWVVIEFIISCYMLLTPYFLRGNSVSHIFLGISIVCILWALKSIVTWALTEFEIKKLQEQW